MRKHPPTPDPAPPPPPTRRTFIKAGLAATGLGPAISALPGCGDAPGRSPRQRTTPSPTRTNESVLVIGAGIAGLAAASELRASGFGNVVVLEARDRIGGRIWTANLGGTVPVDLGASWIHGVRGNPIADLARQSGIETRPTDWDNAVLHFHDRSRAEVRHPRPGRVLDACRDTAPRQPSIHPGRVPGNARAQRHPAPVPGASAQHHRGARVRRGPGRSLARKRRRGQRVRRQRCPLPGRIRSDRRGAVGRSRGQAPAGRDRDRPDRSHKSSRPLHRAQGSRPTGSSSHSPSASSRTGSSRSHRRSRRQSARRSPT